MGPAGVGELGPCPVPVSVGDAQAEPVRDQAEVVGLQTQRRVHQAHGVVEVVDPVVPARQLLEVGGRRIVGRHRPHQGEPGHGLQVLPVGVQLSGQLAVPGPHRERRVFLGGPLRGPCPQPSRELGLAGPEVGRVDDRREHRLEHRPALVVGVPAVQIGGDVHHHARGSGRDGRGGAVGGQMEPGPRLSAGEPEERRGPGKVVQDWGQLEGIGQAAHLDREVDRLVEGLGDLGQVPVAGGPRDGLHAGMGEAMLPGEAAGRAEARGTRTEDDAGPVPDV